MDVFCSMCEAMYDQASPNVSYDRSSGEWVCADEGACLERYFALRELLAGGHG